jgi:hypothetical protein
MSQDYYTKNSEVVEDSVQKELEKERVDLKSAFDSIKSDLLNIHGLNSVPTLFESGDREIHDSLHEEFEELRDNITKAFEQVKSIIESNTSVTVENGFYEPGNYPVADGIIHELELERSNFVSGFEQSNTKIQEVLSAQPLYNPLNYNNLDAYYPSDELINGAEVEDIVNGNNAEGQEGEITITSGVKGGGAVDFSNTETTAVIGNPSVIDPSGLENLSVCAWINLDTKPGLHMAVVYEDGSEKYFQVGYDGDDMSVYGLVKDDSDSYIQTFGPDIEVGEWNLITLVINEDSGALELYLNNSSSPDSSKPLVSFPSDISGGEWKIGGYDSGAGWYLNGAVDETMIFPEKALTPTEIEEIYQKGV